MYFNRSCSFTFKQQSITVTIILVSLADVSTLLRNWMLLLKIDFSFLIKILKLDQFRTTCYLFSHSMLDNYELKIFKLQHLLNSIYHYKAENLKFSKIHKKSSHVQSMQENFNWISVKIAIFFQHIRELWWPKLPISA